MALTFKATLNINVTHTKVVGATTVKAGFNKDIVLANLTDGVGPDKADQIWTSLATDRSLAAGTSETIDIFDLAIDAGAAGTDAFGDGLAIVAGKFLAIVNNNSTDGDRLEVGGEGTAAAWRGPFGATGTSSPDEALIKVEAGSAIVLSAVKATGIPVADGTDHLLKINNPSANTVTYDIYLVGATATA